MSRFFVLTFFIIRVVMSSAQTLEQDSTSLAITMDWLERKLNYNYYDATNEQWWVNVIQENENGAYTIKNISAKHPKHVTEKVYYQRSFFMWDLNPKTVSVSEVPKDMGRFIKGKLVRLEGFKGENQISTTKDGIKGSNVSYLHISIPGFLEDSLQDYSQLMKERLSTALYLNARVFNSKDVKKNEATVFQTLRGNYINEDSTSYLNFDSVADGLVRFQRSGEKTASFGTIGYSIEKNAFFYFQAASGSHIIRLLKVDRAANDLILKNEEGYSINIIGRNTFEIITNGKLIRYHRY